MKLCARCGSPIPVHFSRGPARVYCSSACNLEARGRRVTVHNANGYAHGCRCDVCREAQNARIREYFRKRGGNPYRPPAAKVPCEGGCGKQIRQGTCRDCTRVPVPASPRRRAAVAKLRSAARGTRSQYGAWIQGQCADCGENFTRRKGSAVVPFCSRACRSREAKAKRRALQAGCKVTPGRRHAVHERDDWICKLCGFPVDKQATVPALEAPVIDHIVALARGGEHGPANWQTAHFICNSYKRDLDMTAVA